MFDRSSGVLLHVSSVPGRFSIGDLGPGSASFVDWLTRTGCAFWQVLPLGPPGYGGSPYASPSSFGGNLDLLSPEWLHEDGLIGSPSEAVGHDISAWKLELVARASSAARKVEDDYRAFCESHASWLDDHALFMALRRAHRGASWVTWSEGVRDRQLDALAEARRALADEVAIEKFGQFLFHRQMDRLRAHAEASGIAIVGDMPLYAAHDSVDVWANRHLFAIDPETLQPELMAGVPPDSFAPEGQRWGMPTYRWEAHEAEAFLWWVDRFGAFLEQSHVLRLDHFTGYHKYFAVDGARSTGPVHGEWRDGPGMRLFDQVLDRYGEVPIIVEDLGPIVSEVEHLRRALDRPGMRVVQEAFEENPHHTRLIENFPLDCVVYTGTHDNDTATGRIRSESDGYRERALAFTGGDVDSFARDLTAATWQLPQIIAMAPLQDLLGLGSRARMNTPGTVVGNWEWRAPEDALDDELAAWLGDLNASTDRKRLDLSLPGLE